MVRLNTDEQKVDFNLSPMCLIFDPKGHILITLRKQKQKKKKLFIDRSLVLIRKMAKSSVFTQCLWCLWLLWMRDYSCFETSSTHFHSHLHKIICTECLFKYCWVKLRTLFSKPGQENLAQNPNFEHWGPGLQFAMSLRRVPHLH